MSSIEISDLTFRYKDQEPTLRDVSLTINEPGLYCILGPNGVGKSTLVKCICKILTPQEGTILINGQDTRHMTYKDVSKIVSFVPAFSQDVFSMSVIDTILVGRYNKKSWGSSEKDLRAVYKAMKLLHIESLADHNYNELSAGQHQKVSLARGLVQEPSIMILDEPTANLDVKYQVYVTELLKSIAVAQNMIILMISHDINITAKYADRIIMMNYPGVIYKTGTPDEIITEENMRVVYDVACRVIRDPKRDVPVVLLDEAILARDD